jgi:RNA-binding protein
MPPFDMNSLTSKQRAHLRKQAHHLKPVVLVGSDGVNPAVLASVADALNTRELLKVKLQESAPTGVRDAAAAMTDGLLGVHTVQTIGRTIVLYREHPEKPEIRLPRAGG